MPLAVARNRVSALNLRRLAVPLPPMLPSLNQIGFDFYDLIVGTIAKSRPNARGEGSILMWVVTARRDRRGVPVADPQGTLAFPLAGRYKGDSVILSARDVNLTFTFGDVPLRLFEFRGQLGRDLVMRGPSLYGESVCREVPVYGSALPLTGLCNGDGTLVTTGTYLTRAYDRRGHREPAPGRAARDEPRVESARRRRRWERGRALRRGRRAPVRRLRPSDLDPADRRGHRDAGERRLPEGNDLGGRARREPERGTGPDPGWHARARAREGLRDRGRVPAGVAGAAVSTRPADRPLLLLVPAGYLDAVRVRVEDVVGADRLCGVWLFGSAALGDFAPDRSDLDVQAVSAIRLPSADRERLGAALSHDALPCPARGLEFVLYARGDLDDPAGPAFGLNLNSGARMEPRMDLHPDPNERFWFVIDVAIGREHGRPLAGPAPDGRLSTAPT